MRRRSLAPSALLTALLLGSLALPACDSGGGKEPEKKEEAKKDEPAKEEAKDEEAAKEEDKPKGLAPDEVALPWKWEDVSAGMKAGTKLTYDLSGKDDKGKDVTDTYECTIKSSNDKGAGVACTRIDNPAKGEGEVATLEWSQFSPTFALEKPEHTLVERVKVTVPAGEFDCVVAELKDFFGNTKKVWMVVDKPGVYARVEDMGNTGGEEKPPVTTYELKEIVTP